MAEPASPMRPAAGRQHPVVRLAAAGGVARGEGRPLSALLVRGASFTHPAPVQATWRPGLAQRPFAPLPYAQGTAMGTGSALGFAHEAMPAPVPLRDGE